MERRTPFALSTPIHSTFLHGHETPCGTVLQTVMQQHQQRQRQDEGGGGRMQEGGGQPGSPRRPVLPLKFVIPRD